MNITPFNSIQGILSDKNHMLYKKNQFIYTSLKLCATVNDIKMYLKYR